jgi:hypothetical protein
LLRGASLPWVELERAETGDQDFASDPVERDERWRVVVRRLPGGDA